jgi:hypothetical protein
MTISGEIVVFLQTGCFLYPSKFKCLRTVLEEILVTNWQLNWSVIFPKLCLPEEKQITVALSQQGYSSYKIAEKQENNQ